MRGRADRSEDFRMVVTYSAMHYLKNIGSKVIYCATHDLCCI